MRVILNVVKDPSILSVAKIMLGLLADGGPGARLLGRIPQYWDPFAALLMNTAYDAADLLNSFLLPTSTLSSRPEAL